MSATQFVLVYDNSKRSLAERLEFRDPAAAAEEYLRLERDLSENANLHVVMLSGESLEAVTATHGTYFREPFFFLRDLDGADGKSGRDH